MTKKIQYRDDPSSVEWKDITAADVGAAAEDVSKSILISTTTPPADPKNNKIYIQDNGVNHDIYVKSVYNRAVDGPYTINSLNDLASFDFEPIYEPYQDDYLQISFFQGKLICPNIRFIHPTWGTSVISDCHILSTYSYDYLPYLRIQVYFPAYNLVYSYDLSINSLLSSNHEIKWQYSRPLYFGNSNITLKITKNTPIFAKNSYLNYYDNPPSDPDQWDYNITDNSSNCYFITYNTDNKYDLLDYKDFGLKDIEGPIDLLTVTGAVSSAGGISINKAQYYKWGRIGQLNLEFKNTTTIASNGQAYIATISGDQYRPKTIVGGGNQNFTAYMGADGTISTRNITGATLAANPTSPHELGFTFITKA